MEPDFGGYVTKVGLKCADGRTIMPDAFKHMDGMTVPLVYSHGHDKVDNVLGHMLLEARPDGVYGHGFFNDTNQGVTSKKLVEHKDIKNLSIYANQLIERAKQVFHGMIREVSLVLAGANPGAKIDYVRIQHSMDENDYTVSEDSAIIHTGLDIELQVGEIPSLTDGVVEHSAADPTVQEVYDSMTDDQKGVLAFMLGQALEQNNKAAHSEGTAEGDLEHKEGTEKDMTQTVKKNVFEDQKTLSHSDGKTSLAHDAVRSIFENWKRGGGSMKHAVEDYVLQHNITNIDALFPEARNVTGIPEWVKRRTEWVADVLNSTTKVPFSRVKTMSADITYDQARARGYIKGNFKKEEFFAVSSRITTPTTIYKKQKLERDDMLDITDFDVVAWLKGEMRLMLEEETARAILIGDGRDPSDTDKIKDPVGATEGAGIRSIYNDSAAYAVTVTVNLADANSNYDEVVEELVRQRRYYKGSGVPNLYAPIAVISELLLVKDTLGRRLYPTKADLAAALNVGAIIEVEVMDDVADTLVAIIVNLRDYTVGADKGGEINLFDDFDIDYNQYKYLIETRICGALTKMFSALVVKRTASSNVRVEPTKPTYNAITRVVTIPAVTGVVYKNADTNATLSSGAQSALSVGATLNVIALPASGYYFPSNSGKVWQFVGEAQ